MTTPCMACGHPSTVFVHRDGHPRPQDWLPMCDGCAPQALTCRVCGRDTMTQDGARFRLVYEDPFDVIPHVWAFCTSACETQELNGSWAPDLCERCGREIAAHALGEARLPAHFTDLDGQRVCLSCAAPGVTAG